MTGIHKEGYSTLFILLFFLLILNVSLKFTIPHLLISDISIVLSVFIFLFFCYFFRDPKILFRYGAKYLMSPCDGKVVDIFPIYEDEVLDKKCMKISIFLSILSLHSNSFPCKGKIEYYKYHKGKFLVAWHPKSSSLNERTTIGLETETWGTIVLRQIAGIVARRIICYAKKGKEVRQNEELGFIRFGSRMDIFVPLETDIKVRRGDRVKKGKTIIAKGLRK